MELRFSDKLLLETAPRPHNGNEKPEAATWLVLQSKIRVVLYAILCQEKGIVHICVG